MWSAEPMSDGATVGVEGCKRFEDCAVRVRMKRRIPHLRIVGDESGDLALDSLLELRQVEPRYLKFVGREGAVLLRD